MAALRDRPRPARRVESNRSLPGWPLAPTVAGSSARPWPRGDSPPARLVRRGEPCGPIVAKGRSLRRLTRWVVTFLAVNFRKLPSPRLLVRLKVVASNALALRTRARQLVALGIDSAAWTRRRVGTFIACGCHAPEPDHRGMERAEEGLDLRLALTAGQPGLCTHANPLAPLVKMCTASAGGRVLAGRDGALSDLGHVAVRAAAGRGGGLDAPANQSRASP